MNTPDRPTVRVPYTSCKDEVYPPTIECDHCAGRGFLEGVDGGYGETPDCDDCTGVGHVLANAPRFAVEERVGSTWETLRTFASYEDAEAYRGGPAAGAEIPRFRIVTVPQ